MTTLLDAAAETPLESESERSHPILWWAGVGAVSIAFFAYLFIRWITGPNFHTTPAGPTPLPTYTQWSIWFFELGGPIIVVFSVYRFVIRPWRRTGKLAWDGLYFLACMTLYWQDSLLNYNGYQSTANAAELNWGSWYCYVPGWLAPNGCKMVESPVIWWSWYAYGLFFSALAFGWFLRKIKARRPNLGRTGTFLISIATFMILDLIMEAFILMPLGMYNYAGAQKGWTLFKGHYYQFPIHEMILWGITWALFVSLRVFKDDKGQSFAERGLDDLHMSSKSKTGLRFLALSGAMNVIFLGYNLLFSISASHLGTWPKDIVDRSYFTQTLCGEGTVYACPDQELPGMRNGAAYVDVDGNLVYPPGVTPPQNSATTRDRK